MPYLPPADLMEAIRWLFWLWLAGMALRPLAARLFPDHGDHGYAAGKILGWLWVAFAPWLMASLGAISFSGSGAVVGVLALGLVYVAFRDGAPPTEWKRIALVELGFTALFLLGLAVRLDNPDLNGLEKFMDLGFLATAARSDTMPPPDMWMSGATINYYYYGHAGAALWALLADTPTDHAYQLHMAGLFALTGLGVYRLTQELTRATGPRMAALAGGTTTILVLYAGNLHSFLYSVLRPWMGAGKPNYYFPDSTRFIGFDPDVTDKAFTEFVAYGFKVGDMHAHMLALPIAILCVLLLLSVLRANWRALRLPWEQTLVFGWLMGLAYMTNAWDVAVGGLLALLVGLVLLARHPTPFSTSLDLIGAATLTMIGVGIATTAPFLADFTPFADGIRIVHAQTPLWQLLVVYGHGLPALLAFLVLGAVLAGWHRPEHLFIAILAVGVLTFIAIPEIVFVDDIYGEDYARANTMFKFSFRAQMLLQIVAVAAIAHFASGSRIGLALVIVVAAPLLATLTFAEHTAKPLSRVRALDGLAYLAEERPAMEFLGQLKMTGNEALLEATGDSFGDSARMSAMTGHPAVIGWPAHESLWRNQDPEVWRRTREISLAFKTGQRSDICRVILAYQVRFVVLGVMERRHFPDLDVAAFKAMGREIFGDPSVQIIEVDPKNCAP